jgi:parallel beta-helix repeat protein
MMCGVAEAETYGEGSGIDDIDTGNCSTWSTLLSNNDSTVTCDIDVKSGALNLINATIRMDGNSIWVRNGATMNVTDGSTITRYDSGNYGFNYETNSSGKLNDSTVKYSSKLQIATENNITITNCTIRNNQNYGIHLTSTSGYVNITDCTIANTVQHHGIFIESSQGNILRNNSLNNNSGNYSLYVTGDYDQDIDTTNKVNGGTVYYRYNTNGTITDTNIGHITIVDCNNLSFTGCTIHDGDGVRIRGVSSNVSISGSKIENNTKQGIYFADSSNNLINDSHILDNNEEGIFSKGSGSNNNRIINNRIINNSKGIHLTGNGYNNITDNNVSANRDHGIQLGSGSGSGAHLSTDNILHNNTVKFNNGTGIRFHTNYNRLTENNMSDNGEFAFALYQESSIYYYQNYIWRNNTANGEEVNYYYNEHDMTLDSKHLSASNVSNVGKITLIGCTNITIKNSELSNNIKSDGYGIFLWNSNNNNLTNNTISNNYRGILLSTSSSNNITDLDTISPSKQYGAQFDSDSDYNNITDSSFAATTHNGMSIASEHITVTDTTISSVDADGAYASGSYITLTNVTINSNGADGLEMSGAHTTLTNVTINSSGAGVDMSGDHTTIIESEITAGGMGVDCDAANHTDIINTTITAGTDGINMSQSHWGNLTNNTIDAIEKGIFLTTSRDHNLTANNITNYTIAGVHLVEYSTNTTMIGNDLTWDGPEFDIMINDSNGARIANNESTADNYTFYLTNNTSLCTLDTVFDKAKVGYEDDSNLTLMWRIDVLCWDNYHKESLKSNLTVQYSDLSDANGSLCWGGEISAGADEDEDVQGGRLSGNLFGYWGPPTSSDNWLPIIEYKQNVSGKTTYQPMNCTAINYWDVLQDEHTTKSYRNVTTRVTEPGITICVDTGYTPNSKCYYCHEDKYTFVNTKHWTKYEMYVAAGTEYTPGRCIDCHDKNDSIDIPHGNTSGKDLLYQPSPQLCYTGRTGGLDCHSTSATPPLDQENEFSRNSSHPLEDGKLACKACHDNHGTIC